MYSFKDFVTKKEWYGGSANDPSSVDDEGDGGDGVASRMERPGAFPTYGDDLPITKKNKKNTYNFDGAKTKINFFGKSFKANLKK